MHLRHKLRIPLLIALFYLKHLSVWQFSEAGLQEWITPFVIFCARCRKRLHLPLLGRFWVGIASCSIQQWKLNLELWSSTNTSTVAVATKYWGKGIGWDKSVFASFFGWPEDHELMEFYFGASYSTSDKLLLVARHILTMGLKKCL